MSPASNGLFVSCGIGSADAGTRIVAEKGEDGVLTARAVDDVVEGTAEDVIVELAIFLLAGISEAACGIDDTGQRGRGNAGATDDEPARWSENGVVIVDPDACCRVSVEGKIGRAARITDDKADAVLEPRARLKQTGPLTGV